MEAVDTENRLNKIETIKRFVKAFKDYFGGEVGVEGSDCRLVLLKTSVAAPGHSGAIAGCQCHRSKRFPFSGLLVTFLTHKKIFRNLFFGDHFKL